MVIILVLTCLFIVLPRVDILDIPDCLFIVLLIVEILGIPARLFIVLVEEEDG